jgi:hypothetical protein
MLCESYQDWGWITPEGEFLWPREGTSETHADIVSRYWQEAGSEEEWAAYMSRSGDAEDVVWIHEYPWAWDRGWIRFTGDSAEIPLVNTTKKQWVLLVTKVFARVAFPFVFLDYVLKRGENDYEKVRYGRVSKKEVLSARSAHDAMKFTSEY